MLLSPSLMLLPLKIDPLSEEQDHKKYTFVTFSISCFKMVFALPAKIVAFYIQAPIL